MCDLYPRLHRPGAGTGLQWLQTAVRILAEGRGKTADRLNKAIYALVALRAENFPKHLRVHQIAKGTLTFVE